MPIQLMKILKKISYYPSKPIYIVFNLTHDPLKLHTQFLDIIDEPLCAIRWHQSHEAEFLELQPQAIINLPAQRMLLNLLLRHMSSYRFRGAIIQISSTQLLTRPPFSTIRTLMKNIITMRSYKKLPYQVIIYNSAIPEAQDAIIFKPEKNLRQFPLLWTSIQSSFQHIIEEFKALNNVSSTNQATHFDVLMDPTEYLLASIGKNNTVQCQALHLIGFGITNTHDVAHPILKPYHPQIWPHIISKTSMVLIILSLIYVVREHYVLEQIMQEHKNALRNTSSSTLTAQLLNILRTKDNYWSSFITASPLPPLEYPDEALKVFQQLPQDTQIHDVLEHLKTAGQFENTHEINTYYDQVAQLICTLRAQENTPHCLTAIKSSLIHLWASKQLALIENSILPIDTAHADVSVKINQLNYILKHPNIVGEHVHQRLGLVESISRQYPDKNIEKKHNDIKELVVFFKDSGTYKTIQYIYNRYTQDTPLPLDIYTPMNSVDAHIMQQLNPLEHVQPQHPPMMHDIVIGWDTIYRSYLPLKGCFPLHQHSHQDCDVQQFIQFFQPKKGTFDRLWQQYFGTHVIEKEHDELVFTDSIASYITPEVIERYMQVRIIQSIFFASDQPTVSLRLRPEITHKDLHVDLRLPHKTYVIDANMHTEVPINWSYTEDDFLSFTFKLKEEEKIIEYRGPWALMHLMNKHLIPGAQYNTLELHALQQTLRMNLIGHPHLAPWYTHLYDGFNLPDKILVEHAPQSTAPLVLIPQSASPVIEKKSAPAPAPAPQDIVIDDEIIIEDDTI